MDTVRSARQVAAKLGTTTPRIVRAVDRLGLDVERTPGGRLRLLPRHVRRLERELGTTPSLPGLSRTEVRVLAALASAPLGLPSERSLAVRAGVSPTAAGQAVDRLAARGLVQRERRSVAMGGVRAVDLIQASVASDEWCAIAGKLGVVPPRQAFRSGGERRVPARLGHLFWNTAPEQLDVREHGGYVARRLLVSGDLDGLAWGRANLAAADWEHASRARGIGADRRALARNLAAATG
jgi:hypothetical protein